jgi:hypothetical protein
MSAFATAPGHFLDWLRDPKLGALPQASSHSFVSRRLFGRYVEQLLEYEASSHHGRLKSIRGEVVRIRSNRGRAVVTLADGSRIDADRLVLAMGNFPPSDPEVEDQEVYSRRYYRRDSVASRRAQKSQPGCASPADRQRVDDGRYRNVAARAGAHRKDPFDFPPRPHTASSCAISRAQAAGIR